MGKRSKRKPGGTEPVPAPPARKVPVPPGKITRPPPKPFHWQRLFQALLIVAAVFWIYWPVLHGDWLWDDDYLIQKNDLIHDPDGLWHAWFSPADLIDYFPLTVSVEWLEWQFWPDNTFCYHLTNVILHAGSALLVWHLLSKFGLKLAWLGGLLFAIHPVMVESVAWIAELKNTLSMPPFLLALWAWIEFDRRRQPDYYYLALLLFLAAMLCKTTMVMFPVLILLYAWWKRGRIAWNDLLQSVPFFAISLAIGLAVIAYLRHGVGEETIPLGGFLSRIACAGLSLAFYFSKAVLPIDLLPIYPQWKINPPSPWQLIPWPIFAAAFYWLWTKRATWGRHVLLGFGFFIINLAPFVGFRAISFMRFVWVMDHFLYLPIIGLLGLTVAALGQLHERIQGRARVIEVGCVAAIMILLAIGSHRYAKVFVNSLTQWNYTIRRFPDAWPAHNNLGNALSNAKKIPEAMEQYEEALKINPGYPEAHNNLGIIFVNAGRYPEGIEQFEEALQLCPDLETAKINLAYAQRAQAQAPKKN